MEINPSITEASNLIGDINKQISSLSGRLWTSSSELLALDNQINDLYSKIQPLLEETIPSEDAKTILVQSKKLMNKASKLIPPTRPGLLGTIQNIFTKSSIKQARKTLQASIDRFNQANTPTPTSSKDSDDSKEVKLKLTAHEPASPYSTEIELAKNGLGKDALSFIDSKALSPEQKFQAYIEIAKVSIDDVINHIQTSGNMAAFLTVLEKNSDKENPTIKAMIEELTPKKESPPSLSSDLLSVKGDSINPLQTKTQQSSGNSSVASEIVLSDSLIGEELGGEGGPLTEKLKEANSSEKMAELTPKEKPKEELSPSLSSDLVSAKDDSINQTLQPKTQQSSGNSSVASEIVLSDSLIGEELGGEGGPLTEKLKEANSSEKMAKLTPKEEPKEELSPSQPSDLVSAKDDSINQTLQPKTSEIPNNSQAHNQIDTSNSLRNSSISSELEHEPTPPSTTEAKAPIQATPTQEISSPLENSNKLNTFIGNPNATHLLMGFIGENEIGKYVLDDRNPNTVVLVINPKPEGPDNKKYKQFVDNFINKQSGLSWFGSRTALNLAFRGYPEAEMPDLLKMTKTINNNGTTTLTFSSPFNGIRISGNAIRSITYTTDPKKEQVATLTIAKFDENNLAIWPEGMDKSLTVKL